MVSDDKAKQLHTAEVDRQTAPDKFCPYCLQHGDGFGRSHKQVVKVGTICPVCANRVD